MARLPAVELPVAGALSYGGLPLGWYVVDEQQQLLCHDWRVTVLTIENPWP